MDVDYHFEVEATVNKPETVFSSTVFVVPP
jgi:hypothetical protein